MRGLSSRVCRRVAGALMLLALAAAGADQPRAHGGTQPDPDQALLRELAERHLTRDHRLPVRLFPGELPPEVTFDLPVPPGGRLIGSVLQPWALGSGFDEIESRVEVILDSSMRPGETIRFYEDALTRLGWRLVGPSTGTVLPRPGEAATASLCHGEAPPRMDALAMEMFDGRTDVRLRLYFGNQGPCARAQNRPPLPTVPRLTPEQEDRARDLALAHPLVMDVLSIRDFTMQVIEEWNTLNSPRIIGATVLILLAEPLTLQREWPAIVYDEMERDDPPYEETSIRYTARDATYLIVRVDLIRDRVVEVRLHRPVRH